MKRWICGVCGYVHEGDQPPEQCPACGAPASVFSELRDETTATPAEPAPPAPPPSEASAPPPAPPPEPFTGLFGFLARQLSRHHAHPISVHIPNGVLPAALVFLLAGWLLGSPVLERAAFYNLVLVALAMPAVLLTGYVDWKIRFRGYRSALFMTKFACAAVVGIGSIVLLIWGSLTPEATAAGGAAHWSFVIGHLVVVGAAILAGFLGGRLVFHR